MAIRRRNLIAGVFATLILPFKSLYGIVTRAEIGNGMGSWLNWDLTQQFHRHLELFFPEDEPLKQHFKLKLFVHPPHKTRTYGWLGPTVGWRIEHAGTMWSDWVSPGLPLPYTERDIRGVAGKISTQVWETILGAQEEERVYNELEKLVHSSWQQTDPPLQGEENPSQKFTFSGDLTALYPDVFGDCIITKGFSNNHMVADRLIDAGIADSTGEIEPEAGCFFAYFKREQDALRFCGKLARYIVSAA